MRVYDSIIRQLVAEGVDTVFTLMAEDIMETLSEIEGEWSSEISVIETRHEQGAMAMAEGYSRVTGDIGVCIVGRGPGIAQTGTALVTSRKKGSKLLVLAADSPIAARHDLKHFDQEMYLKSTVGNVTSIRNEATVVQKFQQVLREIRSGQGPIAVQVPWDVLDGDVSEAVDQDGVGDAVSADLESRLEPDPAQVGEAVDVYLDSDATKPPIILAGDGAVRAGARESIEQLAERMSAYLTTTLQAKGFFSGHPFSLGFVGGAGQTVANECFAESDFVLALGCSLNDHTTDSGSLVEDAKKIVQVDTDPAHIGRFTPVDLGVIGDVEATVTAIDAELEDIGVDRSGEFWRETIRERSAAGPWEGVDFRDDPERIDPRLLVSRLNDILPDDRLVAVDGGHFTGWIIKGMDVTDPRDFLFSLDFVALGQGLPMGIGAGVASEQRTCTTFCGDAGFMMALQELDTAVRRQIPVVIVVLNDDAYGAEYHMLSKSGRYADAAHIDAPDLAEIAESVNAEGHTVRNESDLDAIADRLTRRPDGPVVVDCKVNRDVTDMWWE